MKITKYFVITVLVSLFAFSCSDEFGRIDEPIVSKVQNLAGRRSFEEAIQIAENAIGMLEKSEVKTRGAATMRRISLPETHVVRSGSETRTACGIDTLMYVFNFEDSLGFAVVSTNRATPGLIAITESGYYNPEEEQENKAFEMLMGNALLFVSKSRYIRPPVDTLNHDTLYDMVESIWPLVPVRWGQKSIYGSLCPNDYAGCAPVAVAQALSYFGHLDSLAMTYSGHDINIQYLDWVDICKHKLYYKFMGNELPMYCQASDSAHTAISRLCRQLGELMHSDYVFPNSTNLIPMTNTSADSIVYVLRDLGFPSAYFYPYCQECTMNPIRLNHILLFIGENSQTGVWHAWIVDGFLREKIVAPVTLDDEGNPVVLLYNHVNWGWDGIKDGYYLDGIFDSNCCHTYDASPYGSPNNIRFMYNQNIYYINLYR